MTDSLFSSIRIVALLLSSDGELHPLEKSWFSTLINTCGPNSSQRKILREDLQRKSKVDVEALYFEVTAEKDLKALANFLRVASHLDGKVSPEERIFLAKIKDASERFEQTGGIDYAAFGKSLLKRDKELRMWEELRQGAHLVGHHRGMMGWLYPYDSFHIGMLSVWLVDLFFLKRGIYYLVILIAVFFFAC